MTARQIAKRLLLSMWLFLFAGCQANDLSSKNPPTAFPEPILTPTTSLPTASIPLPTPTTVAFPQGTPQPLDRILNQPDQYLGKLVTVDGILEAEGQMPDVRFYLHGPGSVRLEVTPWAPLEVMHPPKGEAKAMSMASYIGLRLRLSGVLKKRDQGIILEVSAVEEGQP